MTETAQALKPPKAQGSALSWLAFLLALGAAGGAAYPFYLAQQGQSEVQKLEASLGAELGDLRMPATSTAMARPVTAKSSRMSSGSGYR